MYGLFEVISYLLLFRRVLFLRQGMLAKQRVFRITFLAAALGLMYLWKILSANMVAFGN